jgi:hypothetical protein
VLGTAGVGKSPLVAEFLQGLDQATVIGGRCLSYGEGTQAARSSAAAGPGADNGRCENDGRGRAEGGDKREQMIAPPAHGARR